MRDLAAHDVQAHLEVVGHEVLLGVRVRVGTRSCTSTSGASHPGCSHSAVRACTNSRSPEKMRTWLGSGLGLRVRVRVRIRVRIRIRIRIRIRLRIRIRIRIRIRLWIKL